MTADLLHEWWIEFILLCNVNMKFEGMSFPLLVSRCARSWRTVWFGELVSREAFRWNCCLPRVVNCANCSRVFSPFFFSAKFVDVAFGIKKLQITCVVEDDKVGTDFLEESITGTRPFCLFSLKLHIFFPSWWRIFVALDAGFEDLVQSMDIVAFNKIWASAGPGFLHFARLFPRCPRRREWFCLDCFNHVISKFAYRYSTVAVFKLLLVINIVRCVSVTSWTCTPNIPLLRSCRKKVEKMLLKHWPSLIIWDG